MCVNNALFERFYLMDENQDVPRLTEERCSTLRRKLDEASAALRAKIPSKPPPKTKGAGKKKTKVEGKDVKVAAPATGAETTPDVEIGNASLVSRSVAKLSLSAEGGPYNGSVFEVMLEGDGEPRMLGRSTGKKVGLEP